MVQLLDLPPELLHNIYDWLRLIEARDNAHRARRGRTPPRPKTTAFVSRALWPYTRVYQLSSVTAPTYDSLARFAATVAESARLGRAVRTVTLGVIGDWRGSLSDNLGATLATMWPGLTRVESVKVVTLECAFDSLVTAIKGGLKLPALETLEVCSAFETWESPYALTRWRTLLKAAPKLKRLYIEFLVDNIMPDELPSLPVAPGPAFATALQSLELRGFSAPHEPAVANFVNAFPALNQLSLNCLTDYAQSHILSLLAPPAPGPVKLFYRWHAMGTDQADALDELDLRHFPRLGDFTLDSAQCTPDFRLRLPPSLYTLTLGADSTVPLAALLELIRPGTASHLPGLAELGLWLPYADWHNGCLPDVADMKIKDMAELDISADYAMEWTDEVPAAELHALLELAEARDMVMFGNATSAFDFVVAWELRERLQAGEQVVYTKAARKLLHQVASLGPTADEFRRVATLVRKLTASSKRA